MDNNVYCKPGKLTRMGLDFTSALYLGMRHESASLKPWSQLTTGKPAVLGESTGSEMVASQLANLLGCDQAVLASSTLHLFWDLLGILADERIAIFQDGGAYSVAQWGIERAAARGVPVYRFPHKDVSALQRLLARPAGGRRPVVVSDGMCTTCGCGMPIKVYYEAVRRAGGLLVIDDTQALGILGNKRDSGSPYGSGGGGSLRHQDVSGANIIVISSLAKGFGVPMAVLSGDSRLVQKFKAKSQTRLHCSPPSAADIHAAERALQVNAIRGNVLRLQLAQRVQQFRLRLHQAGFACDGGLFPIQTLRLPADLNLGQVHKQLDELGIHTFLRYGCDGESRLSLIVTARHSLNEIENAVQAIVRVVSEQSQPELEGG
jgi:8-amino-7-oxononanoate synthase